MTIEKRVKRLEERQSVEEMMSQPRLSGDDIIRLHLGLDPGELRAEQKKRAAQGEDLCRAKIVAEKLGITFTEFKAILKRKVRS